VEFASRYPTESFKVRKSFKASFVRQCGELMDAEKFAEYLEGKTLEEIVHKAKKESEKRM